MAEDVNEFIRDGRVFCDAGDFESALACFDRALVLAPNNPDVWCDKGVVLWRMDRTDEASACYKKALDFDPYHAQASYNHGVGYLEFGALDEAIGWFDRALSRDRDFADAWYNKGHALLSLKRYSQALACFIEAQRLGHLLAKKGIRACQVMQGLTKDQ